MKDGRLPLISLASDPISHLGNRFLVLSGDSLLNGRCLMLGKYDAKDDNSVFSLIVRGGDEKV